MFGWISDSLLYKQLVWHLPPKNREKREKGRKGWRAEGRASSRNWHEASHPQARQAAAISPVPALSPARQTGLQRLIPGPRVPSAPQSPISQSPAGSSRMPTQHHSVRMKLNCCSPLPGLLLLCCPASVYGSTQAQNHRDVFGVGFSLASKYNALILFCHVS